MTDVEMATRPATDTSRLVRKNGYPAARMVAANMRRLRRRRGWTQEELGVRLGGWTKTLVSAAEKTVDGGRPRMFVIDEVVLLAEVFGVSVTELLKPIPPCAYCGDSPAPGMKCLACGASDKTFNKVADEE